MDWGAQLRTNLTDESKAYGYTLVIWGTGAVLIKQFGIPTVTEVFLYAAGAALGFGALALIVYGSVFGRVPNIEDEVMIVASMVHIIAAIGTIGAATLLIDIFPISWAFLTAGINASLTYNVLMLGEVLLSEELAGLPW